MLLRVPCLIAMILGVLIMIHTTWRYRWLIGQYREEGFLEARRRDRLPGRLLLIFLYVFILSFCVGFTDVLLRDVQLEYVVIVVLLLLGSIFIASAVETQVSMTRQIRDKGMEVMRTFVNAIDMKDGYTKGHSEHVHAIVRLFVSYLDTHGIMVSNKTKLLIASLLHDCGKISISDSVLNKMGPLDDEDWNLIRTHPYQGKKLLDDTCFSEISDWVLYHHERIDGGGYYGLAGDEIPLESRIIAIADTYSALSTNRVYRSRRSHTQAVNIMREAAGTQLDAKLLEIFFSIPSRELIRLLPAHRDTEESKRKVQSAQAA